MKSLMIFVILFSMIHAANEPFTQCIDGKCTTYYPTVIEHEKMIAEQKRLQIEQERLALEKEEYYKKHPEERPLTPAQQKAKEEAEYKAKRIEANERAKQMNKEREMQWHKKQATKKKTSSNEPDIKSTKTFNPDQYKDSPQIIINDQHLYGVSEVKKFKEDKVLIKSANGTFAFPIELFESAQKINFTDEMLSIH